MTLTKPNGYKICTAAMSLVVILWMTGCSITNKSFTTDIRTVKDGYFEVFSPEQKFYLKMPGDYAITNKMSRAELKKNAEFAKQLSLDMNLRRSFILKGATYVSPFYKNMIFIDGIVHQDTMLRKEGILRNTNGDVVYYCLQEDFGKRFLFLSYIVQLTDGDLVFTESGFEDENGKMLSTLTFNTHYQIPEQPNPFEITFPLYQNEMDTLNYIRPIQWIKSHGELYYNDNQPNSFIQQAALTYTANVKQLPLYDIYLEKLYKTTTRKNNRKYLSTSFFDTIPYIAYNHDVLIFNENHFTPKHRMLITSLLEELYHQGYRNLAIEALFSEGDTIAERGHVLAQDGFYTREPEMANLIHEAIRLGYRLINYEAEEIGRERDSIQAENMWNKIKNNDNKTIILCGAGHIALNPDMPTMAYFLKQLSDKKIFTVNQMAFDRLISKTYKEQVKIINTHTADTILLKHSKNDLYIVNYLTYPKSNHIKSKKVNSKDILPAKSDDELFLFVYREKEYQQYGAQSIPFSIYYSSGNKFYFSIPADEPVLILVKNWQNDIIHTIRIE